MDKYSFLDKFFHRLVLGSNFLGEALFDLESSTYSKKTCQNKYPVFVCGLARAGTTTLMRALHDTGQFASLTYQDMPGVMAPNFWNVLSSKNLKVGQPHERMHGDGVIVDFDSPEALDEVFWRVFCGEDYIGNTELLPHSIPLKVMGQFKTYMELVCFKYKKDRYLSKNNNNILRIASLSSAYPDATFLFPFRNPVAQAQSLMVQHKRFSMSSAFQIDYMTWLVHHEFGATHKPFRITNKRNPIEYCPESLDYWLDLWCNVYASLVESIEQGPKNLIPIGYEELCQNTEVWQKICLKLSIPISEYHGFKLMNKETELSCSATLQEEASAIYDKLVMLSALRLS